MAGLRTGLFLLSLGTVVWGFETFMDESNRLREQLFRNYNKEVRPVLLNRDPLEVSVGLTLLGIQEVNMEEGIMTSHVWLHLGWKDSYLKWNPADYSNNFTDLRMDPETVWTPDIVVFNDAQGDFSERLKNNAPNIFLKSDGTSYWVVPMRLRTSCPAETMDRTSASCQIKLGSWTYSEQYVNLTMESDSAGISYYTPNKLWTLDSTPAFSHSTIYDCCPEAYVDVTYEINLIFNP